MLNRQEILEKLLLTRLAAGRVAESTLIREAAGFTSTEVLAALERLAAAGKCRERSTFEAVATETSAGSVDMHVREIRGG